jgi:hypothetical protein
MDHRFHLRPGAWRTRSACSMRDIPRRAFVKRDRGRHKRAEHLHGNARADQPVCRPDRPGRVRRARALTEVPGQSRRTIAGAGLCIPSAPSRHCLCLFHRVILP